MPIDSISGPFCDFLIADYIAHETDTAEAPVPIIQEQDMQVLLPENATTGTGTIPCTEGEEICCNEPTVIPFVNQTGTIIPYGPTMIAKHGNTPTVLLYYYDNVNGGFLLDEGADKVYMLGSPPYLIGVNHDGLKTGLIKIV